MGTFCSDRVRKINGHEQPGEARLSKHERPKFITPISPCPALPYSHTQERGRENGKNKNKRGWKQNSQMAGVKERLKKAKKQRIKEMTARQGPFWCRTPNLVVTTTNEAQENIICLNLAVCWLLEVLQSSESETHFPILVPNTPTTTIECTSFHATGACQQASNIQPGPNCCRCYTSGGIGIY